MKRMLVLVTCAALLASGCSVKPAEVLRPRRAVAAELPAKGDPKAPVDPRLPAANDAFGFKLLAAMRSGSPNTLLSPFSVASALAMTANGADDTVRPVMEGVLFGDRLKLADANVAYADLLARLQTDTPTSKLAVANSLWLSDTERFSRQFLETDRDYYAAEAATVTFGTLEANKRINAWVDERTRGLIPKLYGDTPIPRDSVVVLVNALYFKSDWRTAFDPGRTRDQTFTAPSETFTVPMMSIESTFGYLGGPGFDAVRLPYKDGKRSMYVFVPKAEDGLDGFLAQLDERRWSAWMQAFVETPDVTVGLPRMKLATRVPLNDPLEAMGMGPAFAGGFDGITETKHANPVAITDVVHAVTVEVDEKGTKAAAATGVTVGVTGVMANPRIVVADRPFFFAIRDDASGVVLFAGAVRDPRK